MWRRLFEDCNKKQGEELERLRQEYDERSKRLGLTTRERSLPAGSVPRRPSPVGILTPRELSQMTKVEDPTTHGRVTIPDPNDMLADSVVEKIIKQMVEAVGRLVC